MPHGDRIGAYEIKALLGKGGMGEVYRAHDPKLNRDVAIKVLPPALARDADYIARFQREAQTLAALNHPNIAAIYGLEDNAIVMELVEGQTIQGPMPVKDALAIALQIAEALEAAHDKGIIHRDLKPGNVKLTPEGVVKVLDFGLAKTVERPIQTGPDSPTLTLRATEAGLILGTAGYMSPEQAAGKPVDRRADIWAFGVVLYELVTGKRLFDGETVTHTLADVVKGEIDLSPIPEGPVRDLLKRCLDRDLKNRLSHIGEARYAIDHPAKAQAKAKSNYWPWVAAVMAVAAIAGWWQATRPVPKPFLHLPLKLEQDANPELITRTPSFDISWDGRRIVYTVKDPAGVHQLATRMLDQQTHTILAGTARPTSPFFSPDGQWIAFAADSKLKKVAVSGGAPITLAEIVTLRGATWTANGNIVYSPMSNGGLMIVPASGGTPKPITKLKDGEASHRWPHALPDGNSIVFVSSNELGGYEMANIEIQSLRTGERKVLHRGGYGPRYLASGHLAFISQSKLFAAPLDLSRLELTGQPVPVLHDIDSIPTGGVSPLALSAEGSILYRRNRNGSNVRRRVLVWGDPSGKSGQINAKPAFYRSVALSPGGKRVAMRDPGDGIWIYDIERDSSTLLPLRGTHIPPAWSPDGKFIAALTNSGIQLMRSDGAGQVSPVTSGLADMPGSFAPDGKALYFLHNATAVRIPINWSDQALPKPGREIRFEGRTSTAGLAVSPDGRWLAFISIQGGQLDLYVTPSDPNAAGRWKISTDGAHWPHWSARGDALYYYRPDGRIMRVPVTAKGDSFTAGKPEIWADASAFDILVSGFEITPDGKRFLALLDPDAAKIGAETSDAVLLLNFFDELKRQLQSPR